MEHSTSFKNSVSSDSSAESIAESALKTPLDAPEHGSLAGAYVPSKALSSRLELLPKRANSGPPLQAPKARRARRPTNESMASITSHSSCKSLLRTTLLLVTSSRPSSRPYSSLATPSLLTAQTSVSSLASTSQGSIPISTCSQYDGEMTFTADATTALSPLSSNSLAQFSTVPRATSSLLQFGVPMPSRVQSESDMARRRRSRDARRPSVQYDDERASPPTSWLGYGAASRITPSISRALVSDEHQDQAKGGSSGLNIPGTWGRIVGSGQEIIATPRPAFPIDSKKMSQQQRDEEARVNPPLSSVDKGKGRAVEIASPSMPIPRMPAPAPANGRLQPAVAMHSSNLPSLASIESNSRLMRSKIVCTTCAAVGPDFPRCGRCGEAWCSRECRVEANNTKGQGGKHRCSPKA